MARTPVLYFHHAIAESGIDAWDHEVLATATTLEEAHELERRFISELKTFDSDYGYNLTHGGDGCVATEETRRKLSESLRGNERLKEALRGRNLSATHRERIGAVHRGRKRSEETRRKLSESHQGPRKPHSDETKARLREALLASWKRRKSNGT